MHNSIYRYIAALLFAGILGSCAQSPGTVQNAGVPAAAVAGSPAAAVPALPQENRLREPAFSKLPAEARDYLERLAQAFSNHEEPFLLAQGEPQFEAENRPRYDDETYLALLYRVGVYAGDSPRMNKEIPRLAPANISHIQYLSWEENGPLLEIKARLVGNDGAITPCLIMLVWRLREPKIEGLFL
jgi:hypothetical protein